MNRYTSKYMLTQRAIVYQQLSKLLIQPLYPQISVEVEKKSVVLNKTVSLTCILLFYMCILHVHWSLHLEERIFTVLTFSLYIKKGNYIEKGRETSIKIVTSNQYSL